ncbi:MAG: hypothetical protein OXG46_07490 [Chloroflexi bacterium]|nr:hypothetical protein [Chloroflexota bacterium]
MGRAPFDRLRVHGIRVGWRGVRILDFARKDSEGRNDSEGWLADGGRFANRPYRVGIVVWIPAPDQVEGRLFAGMTGWTAGLTDWERAPPPLDAGSSPA